MNNITYAAFGDVMSYWSFFPAESGWGRIPVWGFAAVDASNVDGLVAGERVYGYFPMSSHLVVTPARVSAPASSTPRRTAPPFPRCTTHYLRLGTDPAPADQEAYEALLRPLPFLT